MKRLRILHLITELNTGGAEQMLLKVVSRTDRKQFDPIVVSMTDIGPIGEKIAMQGLAVHSLGMKLGRPLPFGLIRFLRLLWKLKPDVMQTWLYHADLLGLFCGKLADIRKIVWGLRCSNMDLKDYRLLTRLTVKACVRLSTFTDAIIVNSSEGKRFHERLGYPASKMTLIPNGFDLERFKPDVEARIWLRRSLNLSDDAVLIGLVARYDPMKDQANFLKAAACVPFYPEEQLYFILVGKGIATGNADLSAGIPERIKGRVRLLGLREDIPRITAGLDISVSSSAYGEGFPNTIGEAMACGVPCVVTDVGDSAAIIGTAGIVIPPRDSEALAAGINRLLEAGKTGRQQIGKLARDRVTQCYDLGPIVKQFEDFYLHLFRS